MRQYTATRGTSEPRFFVTNQPSPGITPQGYCLFPGGVGKTWKEGDFEKLLGDVTSRVFDVYDDTTVIYPGHGDDTTLGNERPHLSEWKERGW